MNKTTESLDNSLSILIEGATEKGSKLVDWLYAQAPDIIQQLLLWHGVESFFKFCFFVSLIVISSAYGRSVLTKMWKENEEFSEGQVAIFIIGCFATGISFFVGIINMADHLKWLQIWIAPKVYLLEYVTNLVK